MFWVGFNMFILALLAFDLLIINKKEKEVTFKESILWVAFWSSLALAFNDSCITGSDLKKHLN